jgi:hypothetical protein
MIQVSLTVCTWYKGNPRAYVVKIALLMVCVCGGGGSPLLSVDLSSTRNKLAVLSHAIHES